MINMIDKVGYEKYEVYGTIGFRRYEYVSYKEAERRYLREAKDSEYYV